MEVKRFDLKFDGILSNEASGSSLGKGDNLTIEFFHDGKPFTAKDGICFLTKAGGNLDNENIYAHAKLNANDQWILELQGGGTEGAARCMLR